MVDYYLLLNTIFYDSPKTAYLALSHYETSDEFITHFSSFLNKINTNSQELYKKRLDSFSIENYKTTLEQKKIKFISLANEAYPHYLKEIHTIHYMVI